MEISITRFYDKNKNKVGGYVDRTDWISYIRRSPFLSPEAFRSRGRHPITRQEVLIAPRSDVGYFAQRGKRIAIVYNNGELSTECAWDNTAKSVLGQIARDFGAVLLDDNKKIIPI
jgi:hypothetical protein